MSIAGINKTAPNCKTISKRVSLGNFAKIENAIHSTNNIRVEIWVLLRNIIILFKAFPPQRKIQCEYTNKVCILSYRKPPIRAVFNLSEVGEDALFFVVFMFLFIVIRIDHDLLNLRECGVDRHKCTVGEEKHERNYDADGKHGHHEHIVYKHQRRNAEHRKNIALEADYREDKGVFQDLEDRKVEGYHENVDVESHDEPNEGDKQGSVEHEVHVRAADVVIIEDNVVGAESREDGIEDTEDHALKLIALDGVPEIAPHEDGLALDHVSHDVCSARVYISEGEERERGKSEADIGPHRGKPNRGLGTVNARDDRCYGIVLAVSHYAVKGGKQRIGWRGGLGVKVSAEREKQEQKREITENIVHIHGDEACEFILVMLKEVREVFWTLGLFFYALAVL